MNKSNKGYEVWKAKIELELDNLVAKNFEKLYNTSDSKYSKIWGEISRELHQRYGLIGVSYNDPEYKFKKHKQRYIGLSVETYQMEEFPWELSHSRAYRFVKQYGKLPKQLPKEWNNFELEERIRKGIKRKDSNERVRLALQNFNTKHSEYAYK